MADYYTLLTNAGIAYETACKAKGLPIKLTQMSVGDGGVGGVYNPDATATALRREVWRGNLNALFQDQANPSWLLAEVTIPSEVGGWYVREAGLWTDTGILYAIIKYPESFKPVLASGSGKEFYIRAMFETSNAALVTLSIDDTIVKATRAWVATYVAEEIAKLDSKQSVRAATTVNISLAGARNIDGVAVVAGDRVLVKNQTQARENGVYVVSNGAWVRAKDADSSAKVTPNMIVAVEVGATQADTIWQLITDGVIVVGTTALTFKDITDGFARLLSPSFAGNPTAPTPELFDSSKSLATTEFVARAAGNYRGFTSLTASASLTTASAGTLVTVIGSFTINLPLASDMTYGAAIHFLNIGGGVVNVDCAGADSYNVGSGAHPVSIPLQPGASLTLVTSPTQGAWWAWGSAQLQYAKVHGFTAPQFDNSKLLATTEFVQRALNGYSSFQTVSASRNVALADIGALVWFNSLGSYTLSLPPPSVMGIPYSGASFTVFSTSVGGTVAVSGGAIIQDQMGGNLTTFAVKPGQSAKFVATSPTTWTVLESTANLLRNTDFSAALAVTAASQQLPGLMIKVGNIANGSTSATIPLTFPVSFPNACVALVITPWQTGGATYSHNGRDKSGATISRGANAAFYYDYIAIGY